MARQIEPLPLALAEQLKNLRDIIESGRSHAEQAMRCHMSAGLELDAAQYAFTCLFNDLATVMALERPLATVHALKAALERPDNKAIAA